MDGKSATQFILLAGILLLKAWAKETVRIVEGQSVREGRVEVYYSGAWGVVCGAGWDMIDAAVVCRLLGYGGASTYQSNITFKPENGTMWLTEVRCIGNETSLWQCEHAGWGENTCVGSQAAGVTCFEQGRPQFISSSLDTITLKYHASSEAQVAHNVQIWTNTTQRWHDARCSRSIVNDSCVVTNLNRSITITNLSPGSAYYVRFSSPTQVNSQVSEAMETKAIGSPVKLRIVSRTSNSITLTWASTNSMGTTYTVEMSCCKETNWVDAHCTDNLIGQGCTVSDTTATVIGLKANTKYFFRVYAVYNNWKSAVSLSSRAMETKSEDKSLSPYKIWIRPLSPKCVTTEIGHVITLFCNVPGSTFTVYEWTKEGQVLANDSRDSVLNVTISSLEDFGEYTCHAVSSDGVTSYNISVCQSTADVEEASEDSFNRTAIAVITACFVCFAIFIVVLILLKMARIHRRRRKQSLDINTGREEMAMLHYRQKSFRSGNNNEEDLD